MAAKKSEFFLSRASIWDIGDIRNLEEAAFEKDAWPFIEMIGVLSFPTVERWKAEFGDRMVGFVAVDVRKAQDLAWIATIAVHPNVRRMGLGSLLMEKAEGVVKVSRMRLSVRVSNQGAIQLYQKLAYEQIDVWPKYYKGKEDAIVMEKELR